MCRICERTMRLWRDKPEVMPLFANYCDICGQQMKPAALIAYCRKRLEAEDPWYAGADDSGERV